MPESRSVRLLSLCVALLATACLVCGCYDVGVGQTDVDVLKTQVARDYPEWNVGRAFTSLDSFNGSRVAVELRWHGPEDLRTAPVYFYDHAPADPGWTRSTSLGILRDPKLAQGFIAAFTNAHREPGLVVKVIIRGSPHLDAAATLYSAGAQGRDCEVTYWTASEFEKSNGALETGSLPRHTEVWRAVATSSGVEWSR